MDPPWQLPSTIALVPKVSSVATCKAWIFCSFPKENSPDPSKKTNCVIVQFNITSHSLQGSEMRTKLLREGCFALLLMAASTHATVKGLLFFKEKNPTMYVVKLLCHIWYTALSPFKLTLTKYFYELGRPIGHNI